MIPQSMSVHPESEGLLERSLPFSQGWGSQPENKSGPSIPQECHKKRGLYKRTPDNRGMASSKQYF